MCPVESHSCCGNHRGPIVTAKIPRWTGTAVTTAQPAPGSLMFPRALLLEPYWTQGSSLAFFTPSTVIPASRQLPNVSVADTLVEMYSGQHWDQSVSRTWVTETGLCSEQKWLKLRFLSTHPSVTVLQVKNSARESGGEGPSRYRAEPRRNLCALTCGFHWRPVCNS